MGAILVVRMSPFNGTQSYNVRYCRLMQSMGFRTAQVSLSTVAMNIDGMVCIVRLVNLLSVLHTGLVLV
jgi:hypothetical protein